MIYIFKFGFLIVLIFTSSLSKVHDEDRKWLHITFERKWSVDENKHQLYNPGSFFYVDDEHQIYVSDLGDMTVKMLNSRGNFVQAFGTEKGAGPGEIRVPIGVDIDQEGNVWIADPPNSRVTIFRNDGGFVKHIPLEVIPYRLAIQGKGDYFYIFNQNASQYGLFSLFSKNGEPVERFGTRIVENQLRDHIMMHGEITVGKEGNIFYSPDYAGLLAGYNLKGNEVFKTQEIVPTPFPGVFVDSQGGSRVNPGAERVSRGIQTDEQGKVYIFSHAVSSNEEQALDVYDQNSGEYLHSMRLPEKAHQVYLKNDIIYTLRYTTSELTITAWDVLKS